MSIHIISLPSKDLHNEGVNTSSVANEDHIALIIYVFYGLNFLLPNILALSLTMPSMIYGLLHDDKIQSSSAYMRYRFPPVYVSKSKMCLGSLTLFHHMSPLLSCRFRYLKLIKLVTSGPDHAMRYESVDMVCAHDILGLIFLRGNTVGAYCGIIYF